MNLLERRREMMMGVEEVDPYVLQPFTIVMVGNTTIEFTYASNYTGIMKAKLNDGAWITLDFDDDDYYAIEKAFGSNQFRSGDRLQLIGTSIANLGKIQDNGGSTYRYNLEGNLMSLIGGDNFVDYKVIPSECFKNGVFRNAGRYVGDISNFRIAATTVGDSGLYGFFYNGYSLYGNIKKLLPATNLGSYCYYQMFGECQTLESVPDLPATDLTDANYCYSQMFYNCKHITVVPQLPATILEEHCYQTMFYGCTQLITPPELPAMNLKAYCYQGMFRGCTALTTAPVLPATTLPDACYKQMFQECAALSYVKAMFTTAPTDSSSGPTYRWLRSVSSTGTFVKNSSATWTKTGENGIPSNWTVQTASS